MKQALQVLLATLLGNVIKDLVGTTKIRALERHLLRLAEDAHDAAPE